MGSPFYHKEKYIRISRAASKVGLRIRSTNFKAWVLEDNEGNIQYIRSIDEINYERDIVPSNKIAKEILDEVSIMWDDYAKLNSQPSGFVAEVDPEHIHRTLTKLKTAVVGRKAEPVPPVKIVSGKGRSYDTGLGVLRFNPKSWRNALYGIAWQWACEQWGGNRRGQAWEYFQATFYRKVVRTFLARGMYLPPTTKPVKAAPSKAEVQEGKIRRLEERKAEWEKKLERASKALNTINKQLRGHELAKRRYHERTQDEEAAEGSADNNQRGSAGGRPDTASLQNREQVHRHQPSAQP